jgi:DNA-directed RNA polymerase subunit RPC12/RpoP
MAEFKFHCPHCDRKLAAEEEWGGELVDCPECGQEIRIPPPPEAAIPPSENRVWVPPSDEALEPTVESGATLAEPEKEELPLPELRCEKCGGPYAPVEPLDPSELRCTGCGDRLDSLSASIRARICQLQGQMALLQKRRGAALQMWQTALALNDVCQGASKWSWLASENGSNRLGGERDALKEEFILAYNTLVAELEEARSDLSHWFMCPSCDRRSAARSYQGHDMAECTCGRDMLSCAGARQGQVAVPPPLPKVTVPIDVSPLTRLSTL